jgi:hypothetical protein
MPALEAMVIELLLVGISGEVLRGALVKALKSCKATGAFEGSAIKTPKFSIVGFNHYHLSSSKESSSKPTTAIKNANEI